MKAEEIEVIFLNDGKHVKCPRCWHWHGVRDNFGYTDEQIAEKPELANEKLCDACQHIILQDHPDHASVPYIKEAIRKQFKKWTLNESAT